VRAKVRSDLMRCCQQPRGIERRRWACYRPVARPWFRSQSGSRWTVVA